MTRPPTGQQFEIAAGPYRAVVTETGATLRTFSHAGEDLVDGFAIDALPGGCHGQVLAPWPNRLRDGRWNWRGRDLQLPVDAPAQGNSASHGLVRWMRWEVANHEADRVELRYRLRPQQGYPFALDFTATYGVDPASGLSVRITAVNAGDDDAPVALGAHPYLRPPGGGLIDRAVLRVPASRRVLPDAWGIPVATEAVQDTPYDLRGGRLVDRLEINHGFADLTRDVNGRVRVELGGSDGRVVSLWAGSSCRWLQIFTGDTLDDSVRRRSVAIEPMTAPAGALASGEGLTVLASGEAMELEWGVSIA